MDPGTIEYFPANENIRVNTDVLSHTKIFGFRVTGLKIWFVGSNRVLDLGSGFKV